MQPACQTSSRMPDTRPRDTALDGHLVEDIRFHHPVSGRRARRLVFAAAPLAWGSAVHRSAVSLFLAS